MSQPTKVYPKTSTTLESSTGTHNMHARMKRRRCLNIIHANHDATAKVVASRDLLLVIIFIISGNVCYGVLTDTPVLTDLNTKMPPNINLVVKR